jgi:hypothetical protein
MKLHGLKEKLLAYNVVWFLIFVVFGWLILYLLYMLFTVIVL